MQEACRRKKKSDHFTDQHQPAGPGRGRSGERDAFELKTAEAAAVEGKRKGSPLSGQNGRFGKFHPGTSAGGLDRQNQQGIGEIVAQQQVLPHLLAGMDASHVDGIGMPGLQKTVRKRQHPYVRRRVLPCSLRTRSVPASGQQNRHPEQTALHSRIIFPTTRARPFPADPPCGVPRRSCRAHR